MWSDETRLTDHRVDLMSKVDSVLQEKEKSMSPSLAVTCIFYEHPLYAEARLVSVRHLESTSDIININKCL